MLRGSFYNVRMLSSQETATEDTDQTEELSFPSQNLSSNPNQEYRLAMKCLDHLNMRIDQ